MKDNGGPAFPSYDDNYTGMNLRDYACIKLKVPKTNKDWLNEIILEARRDDLAAKAMQGMFGNSHPQAMGLDSSEIAMYSYNLADKTIKERDK